MWQQITKLLRANVINTSLMKQDAGTKQQICVRPRGAAGTLKWRNLSNAFLVQVGQFALVNRQ